MTGTEDGTVSAVVWLEKDYKANSATISSNEHVLFIGNNKTAKYETANMETKYDQFGMKYGWLGKRGMLVVSNNITDPKTYEQFLECCQDYQKEFDKIALKNDTPTIAALLGGGILTLFTPLGLPALGYGLVSEISHTSKQKKIKDQQYKLLILIMYMDGLKEFMEN